MQTKSEIRKKILKIRDEYKISERHKLDRKIEDYLFSSEEYKTANNIFIYVSYKSEVYTRGIISDALSAKKIVYIPKMIQERMKLVKLNSLDDLKIDAFGIESVDSNNYYEGLIDLALVPGTAFDNLGNRIGYGKGYYDKFFFSKKVAIKFGIAYNFQVVKSIPSQDFDCPMDGLVTNKGIIRIGE